MNLLASRRLLPLQIALWILPLAGVVLWASQQDKPTLPDSAAGGLELLAAVGVYAVATLARAERWHAILLAENVQAKRADTHSLVPIGYMGNNALPARSGELLRVFLLNGRVENSSKRTILGTVLVERVLDAITLGGLLVLDAWSLVGKLKPPSAPVLVAALGVAVVLGVVLGVVLVRQEHLWRRFVETIKPVLAPLRHVGTRLGVVLLAGSVAIWLLEATVYQLVGVAVNLHLGLQDALAIVAFTNLASLVPAAPGYIGTYDAAVLVAVKTVSTITNKLAVSYLILLRFVLFVPITIVGLLLLFLRYGGLSRVRAARAEAAASPS